MVLVDTSVWISMYRRQHEALGQRLWSLVADNQAALCGQVWVEFLGGFRKEAQRREYEKSLKSFPFLDSPREAFELASHLVADYPRLGAGDAIIAATSMTSGSQLFTLDKDFAVLTAEGLRLY